MLVSLCGELIAIGTPAAVFLTAGVHIPSLEAGCVPFSLLNRPYKVGFFHFAGRNAHFLGYCPNLFYNHDGIPLK